MDSVSVDFLGFLSKFSKTRRNTNPLTASEEITMRFLSQSSSETIQIAHQLGLSLPLNSIIALRGDLGAGKTTFVKGVANALGIDDADTISSPTFSYLNVYEGKISLFHFDLYRMQSANDFIMSGFEDYFCADGICCIEWPDHAIAALPKNTIFVDIQHAGPLEREILIRRP